MRAIQRLREAGLKRPQIAKAIDRTRHAVRRWEVGETTPDRESRIRLDELAKQHGILLLASDFNADEPPANEGGPDARASDRAETS
jgi:ribosome-binding protein aMBF1 (putative translation factor)